MMVSLRAGEGSSRGMPPSTALAIRTRGPQGDSANTNKSDQREVQVNKKKRVVRAWEQYMIDDTLAENWARFLHDLGLGDFKSKSQCKKVSFRIFVPKLATKTKGEKARGSGAVGLVDIAPGRMLTHLFLRV